MKKYTAFTEAINMLLAEHFWKLMALSVVLLLIVLIWWLPEIITALKG